MSNTTATRHDIQTTFAKTLAKELGVTVEVTCRDAGQWTISGAPFDVAHAVAWLIAQGLMRETSRQHDEELGETFVFMTEAK